MSIRLEDVPRWLGGTVLYVVAMWVLQVPTTPWYRFLLGAVLLPYAVSMWTGLSVPDRKRRFRPLRWWLPELLNRLELPGAVCRRWRRNEVAALLREARSLGIRFGKHRRTEHRGPGSGERIAQNRRRDAVCAHNRPATGIGALVPVA